MTHTVQTRTETQMSFAFAQEQARGVVALDEKIEAARETLARTERVLHDAMEYRDLDAAKEALKDAKAAAVERDTEVQAEAENVKAARAALKAGAATLVKAHKEAKASLKALLEARGEAVENVVKAVAK